MDKKMVITVVFALLIGLTIVYGLSVISEAQLSNSNTVLSNTSENSYAASVSQEVQSTTTTGSGSSSNGMVGGC